MCYLTLHHMKLYSPSFQSLLQLARRRNWPFGQIEPKDSRNKQLIAGLYYPLIFLSFLFTISINHNGPRRRKLLQLFLIPVACISSYKKKKKTQSWTNLQRYISIVLLVEHTLIGLVVIFCGLFRLFIKKIAFIVANNDYDKVYSLIFHCLVK